MLEIVFGDSAGGSLKLAQHYGKGQYPTSTIGIFFNTDGNRPSRKEVRDAQRQANARARQDWERAVPLGGSVEDICCLSLSLSVGSIQEEHPGPQRRQVLERLFSIFPEGEKVAAELLQTAVENLQTVLSRAAAGETLRIWYSSQPDELCGLYWLMDQLYQRKLPTAGQLLLVKLPDWETTDKGTVLRQNSWNEVAPGQWHQYLPVQTPAPTVLCQACAAHWRTLAAENAPLRACLNGRLVSARENLYDHFIQREIDAESGPFQQAAIIGRVLGKYQLGISDAWVALRMEQMLRDESLQIVTQAHANGPLYHRILAKRA